MEKKNLFCCRFLEVLIILTIFFLILFSIISITNNLTSALSSISIFIAIILFYWSWRINQIKHQDNQISLINVLMLQLNIIEEHVNWYSSINGIPEHEMRELSLPEYSFKLDNKINGYDTSDLKYLMSKLQDKIILVNNYANWSIKTYLDGKEDFSKEYFIKLKGVLPEIRDFIKQCQTICIKII